MSTAAPARGDAGAHGRAEPTPLPAGGPNAIAVANGLLGDEWTLWILRTALTSDACLYGDWMRAGPISNAVLSSRLARLVETGLFRREQYRARPVRQQYVLTERGRQTWPILLAIWAWERRWADAARLPDMRHAGCGRLFTPTIVCASCGRPAGVTDVRGLLGPSGDWSRSVPEDATRRRSARSARPPELVPQSMAILGNRWSATLLGAAFLGTTRFGEFAARTGAPPTIVADRLRTFTDLGVLAAAPNPDRREWTIYRLTGKGAAFFPVIACAIEWAQRWYHAPEGPALEMTHRACGRPFRPRITCDRCDRALRGADIAIEPHTQPSGPPLA